MKAYWKFGSGFIIAVAMGVLVPCLSWGDIGGAVGDDCNQDQAIAYSWAVDHARYNCDLAGGKELPGPPHLISSVQRVGVCDGQGGLFWFVVVSIPCLYP